MLRMGLWSFFMNVVTVRYCEWSRDRSTGNIYLYDVSLNNEVRLRAKASQKRRNAEVPSPRNLIGHGMALLGTGKSKA